MLLNKTNCQIVMATSGDILKISIYRQMLQLLFDKLVIFRGLSNTEASIPTVSLVKLFLPSVSVDTDGEMNTRSVNVQNPFVNEVVSIIARA